MSFSELISPLLGRILLAWFFLSEAARYGGNWAGTVSLLALKDIALPEVVLFFALLAMGGISLLLGFRTKLGALALFAFFMLWTVWLHDYWNIRNATDRQADFDIFARNLAIAGGLLFLIGMGSGPFALDNVSGKKGGGRR